MGAARPVNRGDTAWSAWQPLAGIAPLSDAVLAEILDGGQAFRWHRGVDSTWIGAWSDHVVRLRLGETHDDGGQLQWSAPAPAAADTEAALAAYVAADVDFAGCADRLPWRSDTHLAACLTAFRGLRILRQPLGETLLGFLCSATKQIVQIKQMIALLAARHGQPIAPAGSAMLAPLLPATTPAVALNRLPTWMELADVSEPELRRCLLGFRARYISQTARFLAAHPGWLEETGRLPYPEAKARLCGLPGVGEKVADCVLLFGAGRLEAFPVDVWILKTMAHRYRLHGWKPAQLAQFGRIHFGPYAGFAQQFLFAWERRIAPRHRTRSTPPR